MMIKDAKPKLGDSKELKVRIPAHQHLRLHAMRVMTGKQISQTMIEALDAYFAVAEPKPAPPAEDEQA